MHTDMKEWMREFRASIQRNIDGPHGVSILGVLANPPFSYTIGLTARHGFEIIVIGLGPEKARAIFNDIAGRLREGESIEVNTPDDRWLANFPTVFKIADDARVHEEFVVQADNFYGKEVQVLQMVLPDAHGNFPWHAGYDKAYMGPRQTLLFAQS